MARVSHICSRFPLSLFLPCTLFFDVKINCLDYATRLTPIVLRRMLAAFCVSRASSSALAARIVAAALDGGGPTTDDA